MTLSVRHELFNRFAKPPTVLKQYIQGLPSGFDLKYLALADRNMQVRFGLKVVWESLVVGI